MKTQSNFKIFAIYYESQEYAGAEFQLIRIIKRLLDLKYKVILYDNNNFISDNCPGLIKLDYNQKLSFADYFLYFACDILDVKSKLKITCVKNEIIWSVHPDNYFWMFPVFFKMKKIFNNLPVEIVKILYPIRYKKIEKIISNSNKRLFFMDGINYSSFEALFNQEIPFQYLPIVPNQINKRKIIHNLNNELKVLFVGRLVDFKVRPLITFINQISKSKVFENYEVIIIGSGKGKQFLKEEKFKENVDLKFLGNKYNDDLIEIASDCDLAIGMGTTALDISLMGLPVILSPLSPTLDKYIWLYETTNFNMVATPDNDSLRDVSELLSELKLKGKKIVDSCQTYTTNNHSILNVVDTLVGE